MRRIKKSIAIFLSIVIAISCFNFVQPIAQAADTDNMILKGAGFEPDEINPADTTVVFVQGRPMTATVGKEWKLGLNHGAPNYARATYDTTEKTQGTQSLHVQYDKSAGYLEKITDLPAVANGKYTISVDIKTGANTDSVIVRTEFVKSDGTASSTVGRTDHFTIGANQAWQTYTKTFTAPNNNDIAGIKFLFAISKKQTTPWNTGEFWMDNLVIKPVPTAVDNVNLDVSALTLLTGTEHQLNATISPASASNKAVTWSSSDSSIISVDDNGVVKGLVDGTATITAVSVGNPSKIATCVITASSHVTGISLDRTASTIPKGKNLVLNATRIPFNATDPILWSSSDESVAIVRDGVVFSKGTGTVTITATSGGHSADCQVTVTAYTEDEFDRMRKRWSDYIFYIGNDINDPEIKAIVNERVAKGQMYWEKMNKNANASSQLWTDADMGNLTREFQTYYKFLLDMSVAYVTEGSPLQYNADLYGDIIFGLDWMDSNLFTTSPKWAISNWWERDIGMPKEVNNIVTLLYDYLPQAKIDKYMAKVKVFSPTADTVVTGGNAIAANRVDKSLIVMMHGILTKDSLRIKEASSKLLNANSQVLELVTTGTGIYYDGSFIEHSNIPYTNSYGTESLRGISEILYTIGDSTYGPNEADVSRVYEAVDTAYLPQMYKGMLLYSTWGRSASRQTKAVGGKSANSHVKALIMLAQSINGSLSTHFKAVAKAHLLANPKLLETTSLFDRQLFKSVLQDESIAPEAEATGAYTFNRMARTTVKRDDYLFDLAMYNYRVASFEAGNQENRRGVHTSDGFTYLYNNDIMQYAENFWATVDYKRLPGTTVDTKPIEHLEILGTGGTGSSVNPKIRWAGASKLDNYAVAGMALDKTDLQDNTKGTNAKDMDLTAKKSWFVFDNEIVALGAGINSSKGRAIETIVENRRLNSSGSNTFVVDGETKSSALDYSETVENPNWAYLEGRVEGSDIGYYFPDSSNLNVLRESRTESWKTINDNPSMFYDDTPVTDNYLTMYIDHGTNPSGASYEYAILPGMNPQEVAAYSESPGFEVLSNTADLQAVKHKALGITALNSFVRTTTSAGGVTVSDEASVIVREYPDNTLKIAVMNPTVNGNKELTVTVDRKALGVIAKDDNITVEQTDPQIVIKVNPEINAAKFQNTWTIHLAVAPKPVESVVLDTTDKVMGVGEAAQLHAEVLPADASVKTLLWASDNENVATVNEDGLVTAVGIGSTNIRATSSADNTKYAVRPITVTDLTAAVIPENGKLTVSFGELPTDILKSSFSGTFTVTKDGIATESPLILQTMVVNEDKTITFGIDSVLPDHISDAELLVKIKYASGAEKTASLTVNRIIVPVAPVVQTKAASNVTETSATIQMEIISYGSSPITVYGAVYGTSANPDGSEGNVAISGTSSPQVHVFDLVNLMPDTTYYFRAFAANVVGTTYGNDVAFRTVAFDITPPTGTLSINGGAAITSSTSVTLAVNSSDGAGSGSVQMRFSNDNATWSSWEAAAGTKAWLLASGDGTKTIYMELKDAAGNVTDVPITASIQLQIPVSESSGDDTVTGPQTETIHVGGGKNDDGSIVLAVVINRKPDANGQKRDEVNLTAEQVADTIAQLAATGSNSAKIVISDEKDEVAELNVKLPKVSTEQLAKANVGLEVVTGNVRIDIPGSSLQGLGNDTYFRVVPIKKKEEHDAVEQRAKTEQAVLLIAELGSAEVIGRPMTIETNLQGRTVTLTLPLGDVALSDEQKNDLGIYIEHSDGTKEFVRGEIVKFDQNGELGIRFAVNKFSTFTIVHMKGWNATSAMPVKQRNAYMSGYPDGTFGPERSITRAEMATILARAFDKSTTQAGIAYTDVESTHWAKEAIDQVAKMGLMSGYSDGSFKSEQTITRAEMASIASKLLTVKPDAAGGSFADVVDHWAQVAIHQVKAAGIINGYADGTFRPEMRLTRAEAVIMINKLLGQEPLSGAAAKWSDVTEQHWAFKDIQAASAN
ncbi:polysaccharide lyase family 8 super-sandwich domain-containing protein [Paenibacillus plantarum]|nr:polysaccharide lyase family 8 super-sandwich domain-containing protein [Paenibacillus plantarum]